MESAPDVAVFVVPAKQIARYAAITLGVNVQQVPALIVMRPRRLSGHGAPQATRQLRLPDSAKRRTRASATPPTRAPKATYHPG